MKRLIDANALQQEFDRYIQRNREHGDTPNRYCADVAEVLRDFLVETAHTVDAVEVVRCRDCVHAQPFDRNCELNTSAYMHCGLLRGEETKNVWHKYKKYYKDYSVVDRDGFCDQGERREE